MENSDCMLWECESSTPVWLRMKADHQISSLSISENKNVNVMYDWHCITWARNEEWQLVCAWLCCEWMYGFPCWIHSCHVCVTFLLWLDEGPSLSNVDSSIYVFRSCYRWCWASPTHWGWTGWSCWRRRRANHQVGNQISLAWWQSRCCLSSVTYT